MDRVQTQNRSGFELEGKWLITPYLYDEKARYSTDFEEPTKKISQDVHDRILRESLAEYGPIWKELADK